MILIILNLFEYQSLSNNRNKEKGKLKSTPIHSCSMNDIRESKTVD